MTTDTNQIHYDAVHRQEPFRVRSGGKPPRLSFALPGRLVRRLGSIVLVLPRAVHHGRHDDAVRRGVAAQLIGDQTERSTALSFQQLTEEPRSGVAVAP